MIDHFKLRQIYKLLQIYKSCQVLQTALIIQFYRIVPVRSCSPLVEPQPDRVGANPAKRANRFRRVVRQPQSDRATSRRIALRDSKVRTRTSLQQQQL